MRARSNGAGMLRIILIPLVCALFALSGIAASQANAARFSDPDRIAKIALCLPSGLPDDGAPRDHDCDSCCLVVPVALTPPVSLLLEMPAIEKILRPDARQAPPVAEGRLLPWSRGPPDAI